MVGNPSFPVSQGARYTIRSSLSGAVALAVPPALTGEPVTTTTTTASTAGTTTGTTMTGTTTAGSTTASTTAAACETHRWENCRQSLC